MKALGKVITAMVTPFKKDLSVDYERAAALAERLIGLGSDGLLVGGTTGESPTLTEEEKLRLMETVVDVAGGRVPVWAGTGGNNTEAAVALTRKAETTGVDGIMLVTPYYNKPPQEGLYQHFKTIAEATQLPVMLYNVPGRTGVNLAADTVVRLAQVPNIVAVKEASGNIDQIAEICRRTREDFIVYSGDDSMTLPLLSVGGTGVVSVASHLVADRIMEMVEAFEAGNTSRAAEIHGELLPLFKVLFITTNPIPVKVSLRYVGFNMGGFRLPLVEPTEEQCDKIKGVMKQVGLI